MLISIVFWAHAAGAVIVNTGPCLLSATVAKTCCDSPLADECLDENTKALNDKLKSYQETLARRTAGLHDSSREAKARAEAMRNSAALNLRSAEHCEQMTAKCVEQCTNLDSSDAKSALGRCADNAKIVRGLRDQAAREEIQVKRAERGLK